MKAISPRLSTMPRISGKHSVQNVKRARTCEIHVACANQEYDDTENQKKERTTMTDTSWLVFFPQSPATPSSLRVLVWRRLQQAGALNLQGGAWMLPHRKEQEQVLQTLLSEME